MRLALLALLLCAAACDRNQAAGQAEPAGPATTRSASRRASTKERNPAKVIEALKIGPGSRVADVGAGSGLLTIHLARAVAPNGRVVATDIDGQVLDLLHQRLSAAGLADIVERRIVDAEQARARARPLRRDPARRGRSSLHRSGGLAPGGDPGAQADRPDRDLEPDLRPRHVDGVGAQGRARARARIDPGALALHRGVRAAEGPVSAKPRHRQSRAALAVVLAAGLAGLTGCPDSAENAPTLWLALDGRETEVKLVDFAPPPY